MYANNNNRRSVTVQDVLNSIKKYGKSNILSVDFNVYRDNNNKNKSSSQNKKQAAKQNNFDCTWIPFDLILENGKKVSLRNLKFNKVLTSSSAKMPHSTTEETAKNMLITFREITEEELMASGDYAPKKTTTEEERIKENARALAKAREYIENTHQLCEALEAIDASYKKWTTELKKTTGLGFTINKDNNSVKQVKDNFKGAKLSQEEIMIETNKVVTVYSIRQSSYEDKETKEEVELKFPLTRIKLMVSKDGQIGTDTYDADKGGYVFTPNVYNSRKLDKNGAPTLAKVKVNGKSCLLSVKSAGSFITYRSLVSGIIEFSEIVISKFGISLSNKFKVLYVKRHKASMSEPLFSPDEFKEMRGSDSESEEEVVLNDEDAQVSDLEDKDDEDYSVKEEPKAKGKPTRNSVKMEKPTKSNKKTIKVKKESDDEAFNTKVVYDSDVGDEPAPKLRSAKAAKSTKAVYNSDAENDSAPAPKSRAAKAAKSIKVKKESDDEVESVSVDEDAVISDED